MIPLHVEDLDVLAAEVGRQTAELDDLLAPLPRGARAWRPAPSKWSIEGHVAHLCLVNEPYLAAMRRCSDDARARGRLGDGPYRHPRLGRWFARLLEPPPRRRWKTARSMVPDPDSEHDAPARFRELQAGLAELLGAAQGVDLGRARFGSPFARMLRLSLGMGFAVILAHNRRHLWLMREVTESDGFPGDSREP